MVQVAVYCERAEQAALVELFFPVRANERVEGIVHMPCKDDVAQYCVHITLARPVMSIWQRTSLQGWCSWYAYRGDPACLFGSIDLDSLETFTSWVAFQEDSPSRTWETVVWEYASTLTPSKYAANTWLYGQKETTETYRNTLPSWVVALSKLLIYEQRVGRTITKISLQQLVERLEEKRDLQYFS